MPHLHLEYSPNLENCIDMAGLCDELRRTAAGIETFPLAGVRVRATRVDHCAIADGNPKHGFIHLTIRLRAGRSQPVKQDVIERIFDALKDFTAPAMGTLSLALSAEMRDIDAALSPKFGNIRDHLEDTE